jgi:hypothetical protein
VFGIPALGVTSFATQAANIIGLTLAENVGVDDSSTQVQALLNTIAENIGIADVVNDAGANYFGSLTETITLGDSSTQQSAFLQSLSENFNPADTPAILAQFKAAIAENVIMADNQAVSGWIKIIDAQTANWATISNSETAGWTTINNSQ